MVLRSIVRNIYLIFGPISDTEFLKSLRFLAIDVSFVMLMRLLWEQDWLVVSGANFPLPTFSQSHSQLLGRGEGLEINQSPMANDIINPAYVIKPP